MLGVLLGIAAVVVLAYEYFKPEPPALRFPAGANRLGLENLPVADPTLAAKCGLLENDLSATDTWTATYLGKALDLKNRLVLMRSVFAYAAWPKYAQRTDCVLNPQSNRPRHWQGP